MSKYDSNTIAQLKSKLSSLKLSQSGEKATLISRLSLHDKCVEGNVMVDGVVITQLKMGALKKAAARAGVFPEGTQDEILTALYAKLPKQSGGNVGGVVEKDKSGHEGGGSGSIDSVALAHRVLELSEMDNDEAILSLASSTPITRSSPSAMMRKAYLKLSLLLHPDKLEKKFSQATKVFQALVRAFERLSSPDLIKEDGDRKSKGGREAAAKTLARSNDNCHRTRVCCPRCKQPWSEGGLDGNPEYFYNFLMMGLKQFNCSTCLCTFGCMTAIHKCPWCKKMFEYSPSDYHRQITCGNDNCTKPFGFFLFPCNDRILVDLKKELKEVQEKYIKERESKRRRAGGGIRGTMTASDDHVMAEKAFAMNLIDECPRCGERLEEIESEDDQRKHLRECVNERKHVEHREAKLKRREVEEKKEEKREKQREVEREAAFSFLGGKSSHLWLLDDNQIKKQAEIMDIQLSDGEHRDAIITQIVKKKKETSSEALVLHSSSSGVGGDKKRKREDIVHDLPSNLHSLSISRLRTVCASNGITIPAHVTTKSQIIDLLEGKIFDDEDGDRGAGAGETLMIRDEEEEDDDGYSSQDVQSSDDDDFTSKKKKRRRRK